MVGGIWMATQLVTSKLYEAQSRGSSFRRIEIANSIIEGEMWVAKPNEGFNFCKIGGIINHHHIQQGPEGIQYRGKE